LWTVLRPALAVCAVGLLAACTSGSGSTNSGTGGVSGVTTALLTPVTLSGAPVTSSELQGAEQVLTKRFGGVGLPTPAFTVTSDNKLQVKVGGQVPQDEIEALVAPDMFSIRQLNGTAQAASGGRVFPDDATAPGDDATLLAQAKAQVGDAAYNVADKLTKTPTDQATISALAPFGGLTPQLVAVLPAKIQFYVPAIGCGQLNARNPYYLAADRFLSQSVTACDATQPDVKYLLGPAQLTSADVATASASAGGDLALAGGWVVSVGFTATGQKKWADFTDNMFESQIGMVMGDLVVSAPVIQAQIIGPAVISGSDVNQQYAQQLANILNAGTLTMAFSVSDYSAKA
jgi:preprotein translocase subunit SecD